ncbi:MAG: hypothetical protein JKY86_08580 [Gammaproteobacteria bacterium]|nr:hypothetical protein [Gammaproteobacteria bacterium]
MINKKLVSLLFLTMAIGLSSSNVSAYSHSCAFYQNAQYAFNVRYNMDHTVLEEVAYPWTYAQVDLLVDNPYNGHSFLEWDWVASDSIPLHQPVNYITPIDTHTYMYGYGEMALVSHGVPLVNDGVVCISTGGFWVIVI